MQSDARIGKLERTFECGFCDPQRSRERQAKQEDRYRDQQYADVVAGVVAHESALLPLRPL
jgi:hypothetical protein